MPLSCAGNPYPGQVEYTIHTHKPFVFQIRGLAIAIAVVTNPPPHFLAVGCINIMSYEAPPELGTYYIKSVVAPKNVIEVPSNNPEKVVCSPQTEKPTPNQQVRWCFVISEYQY